MEVVAVIDIDLIGKKNMEEDATDGKIHKVQEIKIEAGELQLMKEEIIIIKMKNPIVDLTGKDEGEVVEIIMIGERLIV